MSLARWEDHQRFRGTSDSKVDISFLVVFLWLDLSLKCRPWVQVVGPLHPIPYLVSGDYLSGGSSVLADGN